MADSESGVLSIRAKELKEVGKNIAHTDKLIKESEEFLFLLNKGGKGDLEVRRKSNTEKLRVLIEKRDRKDKQLEEGSRLFGATSGLVSRLYDGSEAEGLFRKKTVSNKGK